MGISLGDIASFATGVAKADIADTEERLKDRRAELQADRQFYIDMKTKKYESELASFEKENKKYKAIEAVKSQFKGQEPSPSEFGAAYLQETNPTLLYQMQKDYIDNPELLQKQLAIHANPNFKTTTTRESLDIKLKEDVDAITADYKKQLEDARGDSRLVNAILGKRDKKIADTIQANEDSKGGVIKAKEIAVETTTDIEPEFKLGEEKEIGFRVPTWFIEKGKIQEKRTKLNSADNLKSYTDTGMKAGLDFFKNNKFAKLNSFINKDKDGKYIGFKGAGAMVVNHISLLGNGAVDSITDRVVYNETDGKASMTSSVLNESVVKGKVTERINDYTNISQSKNFLEDRENIVSIVPFSIVDANNSIGDTFFETKGDRKTVGESYYKALQQFTKENNIRQVGEDEQGQPIYSIIKSNQQFMNDIQTELLNLRGNTNNNANRIKELMMIDLGISKEDKTLSENNKVLKKGTTTETITTTDNNVESIIVDGQNIPLTKENIEDLEKQKFDWKSQQKIITSKEPVPLVPQETDEGYDPEYNTGKDRSITAGTIRRLKRGNTIPMSQKERIEARRIQNEFRKKQKQLLDNKKRNESLGLPEVTPLTSV